MYKFRPATDRIRFMHQRIRDRVIQTDAERALIATESSRRNEHVVPIIKRARAAYDVCSRMTVRVEDFEIIVGNKARNFLGSCVHPEWCGEGWIPEMVAKGVWTLREDGLYHNPDGEELKLTISPEDVDALLSIRDYWKGRTITATADAWQPDGYDELCRLNVCTNVPGAPLMMMTAGHLTPGFPKIINTGYAAIRRQARNWMDARDYAVIGCQEITGSGNDYAAANGISPPHASVHYGVVLGMAINNGINPFNGEQCSIRTGYLYEVKSLEEVKAAVKAVARYVVKAQVSINNYAAWPTATTKVEVRTGVGRAVMRTALASRSHISE